ncbi:MAG: SMI1/KNR4 family protein [Ruminococcaceae bacterium]|nr:SMI1/KNR4 family protein [Oscillospiraceae bacterium]
MEPEQRIKRMKEAGIVFLRGLDKAELSRAEEMLNIRFPASLREVLRLGLPVGWGDSPPDLFPRWNDFTAENVERLRDWIEQPVQWLRRDVERNGFWADSWGAKPEDAEKTAARFDEIAVHAPRLIPLFGHRSIVSGTFSDDPPIFSSVGMDTIRYGSNFDGWIRAELDRDWTGGNKETVPPVPFWDDVVEAYAKASFHRSV